MSSWNSKEITIRKSPIEKINGRLPITTNYVFVLYFLFHPLNSNFNHPDR